MSKNRKPLKRSILIGIVVFVVALCVAIGCYQYLQYNQMLHEKYRVHIENVLNYTEACIDVDDMEKCIKSGRESAIFKLLQKNLDRIKDYMEVDYIYVIEPLNTNKIDNIRNVIAGVSKEEDQDKMEQPVYLNMLTGDSYSPKEAKKYLDAYRRGKLTFFENVTERGHDYTGMKTDLEKEPEPFAIIIMDVNNLKLVNDTYGHEKGDIYLIRCCSLICKVFRHSPVFRIGGDEFAVVLRGLDYRNRVALIEQARQKYRKNAGDESLDPWERTSAALGMAEYDSAHPTTIEEVANLADQIMYKEKEYRR